MAEDKESAPPEKPDEGSGRGPQDLQFFLEPVAEAILTVDPDRRLRHANRAFRRLGASSGKEGKRCYEALGRLSPCDGCPLGRIQAGERAAVSKIRLGGRIYFAGATGIRDAAGRLVGAVEFLRDVTELEAQETARFVRERSASLASFVAWLTHRVKNPLAGVVGFADLLIEEGEGGERLRKDLTRIREEALRVTRFMDSLVEATQVPDGGPDRADPAIVEAADAEGGLGRRHLAGLLGALADAARMAPFEPLDLNELVSETAKSLRREPIFRGASLHEDLERGLPGMSGRREWLKSALKMLARSAAAAAGPSRRVGLRTRRDERGVRLELWADEAEARDILHRLETYDRERDRGGELELLVVDIILKKHQGRLIVPSSGRRGEGLCVGFAVAGAGRGDV